MSKRSLHTESLFELMDDLKRLGRDSKGASVPALGFEQLGRREEARRVRDMSPAERAAWIKHVGMEHALGVARTLTQSAVFTPRKER